MKNYPEKRSLTILGLIFLLLALGIAGAGYLSYRNFAAQFRAQVEGQLTAIANLKEAELLNWRNERLKAEAEMLRRNFDFALHVQDYFENPDDVLMQRQLQTLLQSFMAHHEYDNISLLDPAGQVRVTDSGEVSPASAAVIKRIPAVLQSKQVTMVDFYRDETDQNIYLAVLFPIMDNQTGQQVIGLVVLRVNPHIYLYPYLQQWPVPSTSAETLLVRREGEDVLFLNELRFNPAAALTLRFPLELTERPAVKAVLGQTGIVEGVGYDGEPVLTDVRAIPGTPWFLVAKIDTAEAYAPLRERLWQTIIFFGALVLAVGVGLILVWRQQDLRYYRQQVALAKALHESEQNLRTFFNTIDHSLFVLDGQGNILLANETVTSKLGYTLEEMQGQSVLMMHPPERRAEAARIVGEMLAGQADYCPVPLLTKNGRQIPVETRVVKGKWSEQEVIFGVTKDLSALKASEEKFAKVFHTSPTPMALSDISTGRYLEVNEVFLETLGFTRDEVIGKTSVELNIFVDPNRRTALLVRMQEQGYLRNEEIVALAKSGHLRYGLFSAEFIRLQDQTLLLTVMNDITERKQAEETLRQSEERHRIIAQLATDDIYVGWLFPDGRMESEWMTGALERITGYSPEEIKAWPNSIASIAVEQDRDKLIELQPRLLRHESVAVEVRIWCKNGDVRWLSNQIKPLPDKSRQPAVRLLSAVQDITERKQAEEALRQSEELYRTLVEALDVTLSRWLPDTTLVFANEKYRRVFGLENKITGQKWLDFFPEAIREETAAFYQDLARNPRALSYERSVTISDGSERHYLWIDTPILDAKGRAAVFQSVGFDLTERKHTEQLVHAQRDLARIIGTATSAEAVWPLCLEIVLWVSGMDSGGIYLFDAAGSALELVYQQGLGPDFVRAVVRYPINSPSAQIVLAGNPLYFAEADLNQIHHQTEGLHALAMIPIQYQGEVLGCFNIASHTLAGMPDFARHALETVATEVGNIIVYLRTASLLRESEEKYRSLVDSQDAVIATIDADGVYHYMNPIGAAPLAGTPEAVVGRNLRDFFPPPSAEWQLSGIRQVITTGQGLVNEYQTTLMDQPIWRRVSIQPVRDAAGQVALAMVNSVDITERKRLETALRQSEERYRIISGAVTDYAFSTRVDENGEFVMDWVAGAVEEITGYTFEEFVARGGWQASLHPDDLSIDDQIRAELVSNRSAVGEMRIFSKSGQIVHLRLYVRPVWAEDENKLKAIYGAVQNITERKQAEAELHRTEKRYRALIEHAPDGIVLVSETGKFKYISPSTERLFGYLLDETLNLDPTELTHPDDRERVIAALVNLTQDPSQRPTLEYRFLHQNGDWRWVQSTFSNLLAVPNIEAIVINFKDITERKQAEEAQRESEERFRTLYETMLQGIIYQDAEGRIIGANPAAERILGLTLDQMQGRSSIDPRWRAIHEDGSDFPGDTHPAMVALRTGEPVYNVVMGVFHPHTEQYVWININAAPQFKPGQAKPYQVYALFEDITARRLNQDLVVARLRLIEFASTHTVKELLQATLDEAGALVSSPIGFYHFVDPDQNTLTLQAWSTRTRQEFCTASGEDSHYPVDQAGVWADCLHQRRPLIHNDYATLENRQGLPAGHAEVVREAVVPIMRGDQVVAILGIGNKPTHYTPEDLEIINTFADMSWDIVERKRAEENLRESRLRVELALKGANAGMWDWYVQTGQTVFNERWAEIIGYSLTELEPVSIQTWIDACHPDDLKLSDALLRRHFAGETEFYECEARMKHKNGSWVWVIDRGKVVEWDASGKPVRMTGTHLDITESKRAEQDLLELNRTLEERVRQRTAEVQDLYDNAPTGYHSLDKNGVFLMMNQTELNWLGYTREEVVGSKRVSDLVAPQSQEIFATTFPLLKNQGWVKDVEFDLIRKDSSLLPVLLHATAVYDEQGNFVMSRSTVSDNTERKKAETALRESEEQNRLLFEESPDTVILFDRAGRVVRANRAVEILTGYSPEQLTGRTWDELGLLPGEQIEQLAGAIVQALQLTGHFAATEFRLQHADGTSRNVGARVFGLKIRGHQHYLTTMRDITAEKQVEETLRLANAELARAARAKDEFLANMSHELRTPLNAILGFSEALLEQVRGPLNERQQASVRNIEASGRHLLILISDILDLSKVEAGRLELLLEVVPVADVCQASLLFVKETALKKNLQLAFHLNNQMAKVQADPKRLKQMLVNLLSNAVKFTPEGGQVSLEVTADAGAGVIHFAVQDSGIGISPEGLARLFQPFTQLDSSLSRQFEGTGLGLALVRRLAELHGGSVTVESEGVPGRGSRFTIALPNPTLHSEETKPPERKTGTGPLRTALVVEDSESAAEQLGRYLQENQIHVVVHPHGEGALDQAIRLCPGVIFLDLLMPDQTGWAVLAQLKADPRTKDIPVIIVSVVDERAKGLTAGAAEYLVKPVSREALRQAISAVVGTPERVREALVIVPETAAIRARILLAEDNEINIEVIADYLQDEGYQVALARNGREALAQADETRPDLILMDIQMPEMDGLEAIRRLRANPEFAATPIIALTALAMPGDRDRCLDAGATEYLTKPVSLKRLVEIIEGLLKHQA